MKKLLITLAALVGFTGCATLDQHSASVQFIVGQAAMRYVEQVAPAERAARATRVLAVLDEMKVLTDDGPISIADLASFALSKVPANLNPSDRQLIVGVINIAVQELKLKVGDGVLSADALVRVSAVLQAVRDAVSIYVAR